MSGNRNKLIAFRSAVVNGSGTLMQEVVWMNYDAPVRNGNLFD